jgi:hypothetical protein
MTPILFVFNNQNALGLPGESTHGLTAIRQLDVEEFRRDDRLQLCVIVPDFDDDAMSRLWITHCDIALIGAESELRDR